MPRHSKTIQNTNVDADYYLRGMQFYNTSMHRPMFWIETDDPTWPVFRQWMKRWPGDIQIDDNNGDLLTSFTRMTHADGLIMSQSSLSNAAAILNRSPAKMVAPGRVLQADGSLRKHFFEAQRFHLV